MSTRNPDMIEKFLHTHNYFTKRIRLGHKNSATYLYVYQTDSCTTPLLILNASRLNMPYSGTCAKDIIADKSQTNDYLDSINIPHPKTLVFTKASYDENVIANFISTNKPVIAKPVDGNRSRGLIRNINTVSDLHDNISLTLNHSDTVMLQEQLNQDEYRFIFIHGKLKSVLKRERLSVYGDGHSTISTLIDKENTERRNINTKTSVVKYPEVTSKYITVNNLDLNSVPKKNERVLLSYGSNISEGASIYNVTNSIHPTFKTLARHIATPLSPGIIGIDIMIDDPQLAVDKTHFNVIEINTGISYALCYSERNENHFKIIDDYIGPMLLDVLSSKQK